MLLEELADLLGQAGADRHALPHLLGEQRVGLQAARRLWEENGHVVADRRLDRQPEVVVVDVAGDQGDHVVVGDQRVVDARELMAARLHLRLLAVVLGGVVEAGHLGHPAGGRVDDAVEDLVRNAGLRQVAAEVHAGDDELLGIAGHALVDEPVGVEHCLGAVGDGHLADLVEVEVGPDDLVPVLVGTAVDDEAGWLDAPQGVGDGEVAQGDAEVLAHRLDEDDALPLRKDVDPPERAGRLAERSEVGQLAHAAVISTAAGRRPTAHAGSWRRPHAHGRGRRRGGRRARGAAPAPSHR